MVGLTRFAEKVKWAARPTSKDDTTTSHTAKMGKVVKVYAGQKVIMYI